MNIRWEVDPQTRRNVLQTGPVGEYLEVVDVDPASDCFYAPVDLNRTLSAGAGWACTIRRQPTVSPADGLRSSHDNHSQLRARAGPPCFWAPHYSMKVLPRAGKVGRQHGSPKPMCSACAFTPMRCARPMPITARRKRRSSSATFPRPSSDPRYHLPRRHGLHLPLA